MTPSTRAAPATHPAKSVRVAHVATVDLTVRFLLLGQLRCLRDEGFDVTAISAPGPWVQDIEDEGIRHIAWTNATRAWDPWADARAFRELVGILRRERFDVVHTHNPKPGLMGRAAARLAGVPSVVNTVHGFYATPDDRPLKRIPVIGLEWAAARLSDVELYQSEEDLRWARLRGIARPGRARWLGNGADLSRFDPSAISPERVRQLRKELGIPETAPVVGTVGRLVAEKGYREFIQAAQTIRKVMPDVRILIVGDLDGDKTDSIREDELRAAGEGVVVTGWRIDVPELLALMDVFVLASWREGMPRSAIEAAAMAKPLILTDIRGCREVARHGLEGLLVPPRDPQALTAAMLRLLSDPELRLELGTAARARALIRFDEKRVARTIADGYRAILGGKRPGHPSGQAEIRIRPARRSDAGALARLHRAAMPDAFLPNLGNGFLSLLYRSLAADRDGVLLVAENHEGVVGFAGGVTSVDGFYRHFALGYGPVALAAALPSLIRPRTLRRVLETARYPAAATNLPDSELLSIAVEPGSRASGVGRALAEGIVSGLATKGVGSLKVVVSAANEGANRFYQRVGFRQAARLCVHQGTTSNVWVMECLSSSLSPSLSA